MGRVIQALLMKDAARRRNFRPFRVFRPRLPWATAKTVLKPTEKPITAKPTTKPTEKPTTKPTAKTIVVKPVTKRMPVKKRMPVDEAHGEAHDEETTAETKILKPTAKPIFPRPPSHPPPSHTAEAKAMVIKPTAKANDKKCVAELIGTAGTEGYWERLASFKAELQAERLKSVPELKAKRLAEFEQRLGAWSRSIPPNATTDATMDLAVEPTTTDATKSLAIWAQHILLWT